MIQEIINFVDTLPNEVFTNNLKPKEGLYILLDIDEEGNLVNVDEEGKIDSEDIGFFAFLKKSNKIVGEIIENEPLMIKMLDYIIETETVMYEKSYNPSLKFFAVIASPFGLGFKVDAFKKS